MSKVALSLVILAALVGLNCCSVAYNDILKAEWSLYKTEFKKTYANPDEEYRRFMNYLDAKHTIAKHNERYAMGQVSFNMGLNQFSDMTNEEYNERMNSFKPTSIGNYSIITNTSLIRKSSGSMAESIDWREHGFVTPVKDQGQCGSCWAFSATGTLEGQHYRATGRLVSLSEQNLIDCSNSTYHNYGCSGGNPLAALHWIYVNGGIETEASYPYEARDGSCRYDKTHVGIRRNSDMCYVLIDEAILTWFLAIWGPIAIAIDASHESFQHYKSGVYDEPACSPNNLNHGVLIVGYGTDPDGRDYYIVKNSWSEKWGDKGYIKMSRNKDNQCGVSSFAIFPMELYKHGDQLQ